ncbi:CocE/NonD family hydrolase [Rhodococcus sp. WAY2]|uniref:CocE/NonD family hydrolase n=1 Tax=Rhodococcus sp. WAY2 TaxID=2663121 RepID=UPI00131FF492|nr:CocE/NonD family hydrolase [Rhodococcus sp. WAY2]QHE69858.1 hydrolase, CocE/NonD family [Rhodococcus sp. WAY2]
MSQISIDLNVEVPMRDGTILRADVYRPTAPGSYPVLIQRTPYDRTGSLNVLIFDTLAAVKRGYIVVQQDTRGRFDSDGEWLPWACEQKDGYDTVVWASGLPGSNGKVGMFGGSYTGQTQWAAALAAPPGLAAIAPQITWSDPADGLMFRGGAIELGLNAWWTLAQSLAQLPKVVEDPDELLGAMATTIADYDSLATKSYWELPAAPLPALTRAGLPDIGVQRGLQNPDTTEECRVAGHHDQVTVPSLNIGGWYDVFQQGTLDNYIAMRARGVPTRLVVGPWPHVNAFTFGQIGDINFGLLSEVAPGAKTMTDYQLDWFENYLRDGSDTNDSGAPVQLFVMGINQWRDEEEWPLQRAVATRLYLHGDGSLSFDQPIDEQSHSDFTYDPADPVPTCGGNLVMSTQFPAGPKDQATVESRSDVLVFSTPVLTEDLEITGKVTAELFAATDGPTTDWVVRLCDVDENGISYNIVDGITRVTTEPESIDKADIDLWSTSIVIKAGHRLRVHVTSSNFPRWDRNPNTDTEVDDASKFRVARQSIHHNAVHPSHLVLPVIPH